MWQDGEVRLKNVRTHPPSTAYLIAPAAWIIYLLSGSYPRAWQLLTCTELFGGPYDGVKQSQEGEFASTEWIVLLLDYSISIDYYPWLPWVKFQPNLGKICTLIRNWDPMLHRLSPLKSHDESTFHRETCYRCRAFPQPRAQPYYDQGLRDTIVVSSTTNRNHNSNERTKHGLRHVADSNRSLASRDGVAIGYLLGTRCLLLGTNTKAELLIWRRGR